MRLVTFLSMVFAQAFFGAASFANNSLDLIKERNPDASAFEVLELLYNEASDFITLNDGQKEECTLVEPDKPNKMSHTYLSLTKRVLRQEKGPLFPEISDQVISIYNMGDGCLMAIDQTIEDKKIVSTITDASRCEDSYFRDEMKDWVPLSLELRKNGEFTSIKLVHRSKGRNTPHVNFGYCWK